MDMWLGYSMLDERLGGAIYLRLDELMMLMEYDLDKRTDPSLVKHLVVLIY